ncbi:hypothetical protein ACFSO0_03275 [Brevibacillus sp. GCM10020057]
MRECMHVGGYFVEPGAFSEELLRSWSNSRLVCPHCGGRVRYHKGK